MVVDASALIAILFQEPDWGIYLDKIVAAGGGVISPINAWETIIKVQARDGEAGRTRAEALIAGLRIRVAPVDAEHAQLAIDARLRFGRKILNMGDCFAYALAKTHGDGALLYKGADFAQTDLVAAV